MTDMDRLMEETRKAAFDRGLQSVEFHKFADDYTQHGLEKLERDRSIIAPQLGTAFPRAAKELYEALYLAVAAPA